MKRLGGLFAVAVTALALAGPAHATTFCVPSYHAACPNAGGNVAEANLETAMQSNATDGIADKIVIASGTFTDADSFTEAGTDGLEIVGAGPGTTAAATRLTTSSNANVNVVNLGFDREIVIRDLTIVIPASIPANSGAGAVVSGDTVRNVEIESVTNLHGTGILFINTGNLWEGGRVYGVSGGATGDAARVASSSAAEVTGFRASQVTNGVVASLNGAEATVRRSRIDAPVQIGVVASSGGSATVENTVVTDPGSAGLGASTNAAGDGNLFARHVTIVDTAPAGVGYGLSAQVVNVASATGDANLEATGLILSGFANSYFRGSPVNASRGDAHISVAYSNLGTGNDLMGDGTLTLTPGNINQDPLFTSPTDFHLLPGSPSVDAADPAPAVLVDEDFDAEERPCDGDGDNVSRRDMGAYELQAGACLPPPVDPPAGQTPAPPPATPGTTPAKKKKCKKRKKKAARKAAKKGCKKRKK